MTKDMSKKFCNKYKDILPDERIASAVANSCMQGYKKGVSDTEHKLHIKQGD